MSGNPNKTEVGDTVSEERIFPVGAEPKKIGTKKGETRVFSAFGYPTDAFTEIDRFFHKNGKAIIALTVRDILAEELAQRLV